MDFFSSNENQKQQYSILILIKNIGLGNSMLFEFKLEEM